MTSQVGFSSPLIIFLSVKSKALMHNIWDWKDTYNNKILCDYFLPLKYLKYNGLGFKSIVAGAVCGVGLE